MKFRNFGALRTARLAMACLGLSSAAFAWDGIVAAPASTAATAYDPAPRTARIFFEGSTTTNRPVVDLDAGQVYIYVGGQFPIASILSNFLFLYDHNLAGNQTGYITPLLFEQVFPNVYAVVGIGAGFSVAQNSLVQKIPFFIQHGIKNPYNGKFTFGYINALVSPAGIPVLTSPGTVDFDETEDGGNGMGGLGTTNAWGATAQNGVIVPLGATFGPPGSGALFPFFEGYRTYSAQAAGLALF